MAFSTWVKCVPHHEGAEYWKVDGVHWNTSGDPRFREISKCAGYRDFFAVLSTEEAAELNAPVVTHSIPHIREQAQRLQHLLTEKTPSGLVVVCNYEWES